MLYIMWSSRSDTVWGAVPQGRGSKISKWGGGAGKILLLSEFGCMLAPGEKCGLWSGLLCNDFEEEILCLVLFHRRQSDLEEPLCNQVP